MNDGIQKDITREGELILHIYNNTSLSRFPVPTSIDASGTTQTKHYFDNYMDWPNCKSRPSIDVKGTVPYVHCAVNTDDTSTYGETRKSWVQYLNTSTGVWTKLGEFVNQSEQAWGLDDSNDDVTASTCRQPILDVKYISSTDDIIAMYNENKMDDGVVTSGFEEWTAIKKICL